MADAARISVAGAPTLDEIYDKLRSAFQLAITTSQPNAATNAALAMAKVAGLLVDRTEAMVGTPSEFAEAMTEAEIRQNILEKMGPRGLRRFTTFVEEMRADGMFTPRARLNDDDDDGEPPTIEHGEDDSPFDER